MFLFRGPDHRSCFYVYQCGLSRAVHHFNVPVWPDVFDRFIALHYTDWESLNGRYINNPPTSLFVTTAMVGGPN